MPRRLGGQGGGGVLPQLKRVGRKVALVGGSGITRGSLVGRGLLGGLLGLGGSLRRSRGLGFAGDLGLRRLAGDVGLSRCLRFRRLTGLDGGHVG